MKANDLIGRDKDAMRTNIGEM